MDAIDNYTSQVESDFELEARDELSSFQVLASNMRSGDAEAHLAAFREGLDRLRTSLASIDSPLFELLLRRMENYLTDLADPTDEQIGDIETFLDLMHGILDGEVGGEVNEAEFFRSLPVRRPADLADFQRLDLEILVGDTNRTAARIVEREMLHCGYRVSLAIRSFEALELAIRTRPDMIISSGVLDEMSGVDLASALAVIQSTEAIPFALLISSDANDPALKRLPLSAAVVKKGNAFSDDFAAALERFGIA